MDLKHYPPNWRAISLAVRARAQGRCECRGQCGHDHRTAQMVIRGSRCEAMQGEPHPITSSRVVLTVAHLCRCRDPEGRKCGLPSHLAAMCQRCHLSLDHADHVAHARANRRARLKSAHTGDLFPEV